MILKPIVNIKIFILIFILCFSNAVSQNVVVNEYYNGNSPEEEWTEILVVSDNLSLINYTLRDNLAIGNYPDEWQGGIIFKPNNLWRELRAGTIIVIHHRGDELIDVDKRDGYIEIGAENSLYFEKVDYVGNWSEQSLSIDTESDIVEILDNFQRHVHSLSHMQFKGGDFEDMDSPKLNFSGECPINESISAIPGQSIDDYNGSKVRVSENGQFVTKGKPNQYNNYMNSNLEFWRVLRTPTWSEPNLTTNILPNEVDLFWNSCDDLVSDDLIQGYLLIRFEADHPSSVWHPQNGRTYVKGGLLGTAVVIVSDLNSLQTSYTDKTKLECGKSYTYRVYAYRFREDDIYGNGISNMSGRGRTYNTKNYAEKKIRRLTPAKPTIEIKDNELRYCAGDSLLMTAFFYGGPYSFAWYLNDSLIENSNSKNYYAKASGDYKVEVTNEKNCSSISEPMTIIELPAPEIIIMIDSSIVQKDTSLILCEGEDYLLNVSGGDRYEWFRNNEKLVANGSVLRVDSAGIYYAVAINDGMECTDTSARIELRLLEVSYTFDRDSLNYYLDKDTQMQELQVIIDNFADDTLTFLNIILPPGGIFSIFAPPPSDSIPPSESKIYTVRFQPERSGEYIDSIIFVLPCQEFNKTIYLYGYKEKILVDLSPETVIFDSLLTCDDESVERTISIANNEEDMIEILKPIVNSPFAIDDIGFPYPLDAGGNIELTVRFLPSPSGTYSGSMTIPYTMNGISDETILSLFGQVYEVAYSAEKDGDSISELVFPELMGCEDSVEVSFEIINSGEVELTISQLNSIAGIYIDDLPIDIESGDKQEIRVLFVPEQDGDFSESLQLISTPCDIITNIDLSGKKNGITFSSDKKSISFDNVIQCNSPEKVSDTLRLFFSSDGDEKSYIDEVFPLNLQAFSHDIRNGQSLSDTNSFIIIFEAMPAGEYYDTLRLRLKPCDIMRVIPLYGMRIKPDYTFSSNILDFNSVELDNSEISSFIISNKGEIPITLMEVNEVLLPFSIFSPLNLPIEILPDSSLEIVFEYSPIDVQVDNNDVILKFSKPCELDTIITLTGRGVEQQFVDVSIDIPKGLYAETGNKIKIPVFIKSQGARNLNEAEISKFKMEISFNPTLLFPNNVIIGSSLDNSKATLNFIEEPPGTVIISADISKPTEVVDGKLFDLTCTALLGNELSTVIIIDSINFTSAIEIVSDTVHGVFRLTGDCAFDKRLLNLNENLSLYLESANPVNDNVIKIGFETACEGRTEIAIYNNLGLKIDVLIDDYIKSGEHSIEFQTNEFQSGIYYLLLKSCSFQKYIKLVVVK